MADKGMPPNFESLEDVAGRFTDRGQETIEPVFGAQLKHPSAMPDPILQMLFEVPSLNLLLIGGKCAFRSCHVTSSPPAISSSQASIFAPNSLWIVHLSVNSAKSHRPSVPRLFTPGTQ